MGVAARLAVAVALATPALAGATCEPAAEGLVVTAADGRLVVAAAVANSPAALGGVAVGDAVLQVNGSRPTTCEGWRAAVASAARGGVDLLVLTQRGPRRRVVVVAAAGASEGSAVAAPTGGEAAESGGERVAAAPAAPTTTPPARAIPRPTVELLPDAVPVTRADVVALIGELGPDGRSNFAEYETAVRELRRALSTLLVRDPGTEDADVLLRIVRRHEGAMIAWDAVETIRRRQGLRSSVPVSAGATESFFAESEVARLIEEVPTLARAVRTAPSPSPNRIEVAGRWEPMRARGLLWAEADRLFDELVGRGGRD